jgi:hypothetical protein
MKSQGPLKILDLPWTLRKCFLEFLTKFQGQKECHGEFEDIGVKNSNHIHRQAEKIYSEEIQMR